MASEWIAAACIAIWVWKFVQAPSRYARFLWPGTLLGVIVFGAGTFYVLRGNVPRNDFLSFYVAARNPGRGLYSNAALQASRESATEKQYPMPFVRIPFYALVLRPLGWMSYRSAYWVWQLLSAAAFIGSAALSMQRYRPAIAAFAWSLPLWLAWGRGQDIAFVLLFLLGAVLLLEKDWKFIAGLVLSLCSLKWNLFLSLTIFVLRFRSKRLLYGLASGGAVITALSFAAAGSRWLFDYLKLLRDPLISPHIEGMPNLAGMFFGVLPPSRAFPLMLLIAICVLVINWMIVSSTSDLWYSMAATAVCGIVITPHSYVYDCALLVPFLVAVVHGSKSFLVRYLTVLALTPVFALILVSPRLHLVSQIVLVALPVAMLIETRAGVRQGATDVQHCFSHPGVDRRHDADH